MEYKKLNQIRDTYPGEPDTVSNSYTPDGAKIELTGKYPQNFIHFDKIDISNINLADVNIAPNLSFRFIVRFRVTPGGRSEIDSETTLEEWTSPDFLRDLQEAQQENNPYFTKDKVTIVEVDYGFLSEYWKRTEFLYSELYANVTVTDTITTREDMLIHINWLVSSVEELRPVNTFGAWVVELTDSLGFEYSDIINQIERGDEVIVLPTPDGRGSSNLDFDGSPRGDTNVDVRDTPDGRGDSNLDSGGSTRGETNVVPRSETTTTPIGTRSSSVNTNYSPFNSAGRYTGETRSFNGTIYLWADGKWNETNQ